LDCHGRSQVQDFYLKNRTNVVRRYEKEENLQGRHPIVKNFSSKKISARIFLDEKIFTVEVSVNRRNNRCLAHDSDDVPVVSRIKFPASDRVLGIMSNEGDVPPISSKRVKWSSMRGTFIFFLIKLWIKEVTVGKPYIFQQDSALAYYSHLEH
jgi:hypothetical protein